MIATIDVMDEKKTYADYALLPEGSPYELINGELVMSPAPIPYHQRISLRLANAIYNYVLPEALGEVLPSPIDVYLDEHDTFQPDIIFISKERLGIIGAKYVEGAPDLVVEILSPSTASRDLFDKRRVYESSGVREYWIVHPERKLIEVYENIDGRFVRLCDAEGTGRVESKVIGGFGVDVAGIF